MSSSLGGLVMKTVSGLLLAACTFAPWEPAAAESTGKLIYEQTLRSTCWVRLPKTFGSGTLIDRSRKLVLTSCHVVLGKDTVKVWFPVFEKEKVVSDRARFEKLARPVPGKVIARDPSRDLALIELESVPEGVTEMKLATEAACSGDRVHAVGNGQSNGSLFGYHAGVVRQVCQRRDSYAGVKIDCRVLETQSPHNPGDSGGPTVNDKGELVAVTAAYVIPAQLISFHIDISEIRHFLKTIQK
jgi:S1-C subfamily serine protease